MKGWKNYQCVSFNAFQRYVIALCIIFSRRPVLSLENNAMQGLFNSVSQPNLSGSVSPTPQTPNQNTDFKPKKRLGKKNNLSFEDESIVKVNLEGTV